MIVDDEGNEVGPDHMINIGPLSKDHPLSRMFADVDVLKLTGAGSPFGEMLKTVNSDMLGMQSRAAELLSPVLAAHDEARHRLTDFARSAGADIETTLFKSLGPLLDAQRNVTGLGADFQTKIADSLGPIIDMKSSLGPALAMPEIPDYSHVLEVDDTIFRHKAEEHRATLEMPVRLAQVVTVLEKLEAKIEEGQAEQAAHNRKQIAHNELQALHNRRESRKTTWLIGLAVATVLVGALGWARHSDSPPVQGPAPVHVQHVTTSHPTTEQVTIPYPLGSLLRPH